METSDLHRLQFLALVEVYRRSQNLPRAQAVFEFMDKMAAGQLAAHNIQIACKSGCSYCCYQQVPISREEWDELERRLNEDSELFNRLRSRMWDIGQAWQNYTAANPDALTDFRKTGDDWRGQACMFLDQQTGQCTVYEIRPLVCRGYVSITQCDSIHTEKTAGIVGMTWLPWIADYLRNGAPAELLPMQEWVVRNLKDRL